MKGILNRITYANIALGLQFLVTIYHWFINAFHPLVFISIITVLACVVYLGEIERHIFETYCNLGIKIPSKRMRGFKKVYFVKFAVIFFFGAYYFQFVKWIFVGLQYIAEAMAHTSGTINISTPLKASLLFKIFTAKETFWILPTGIIGFFVEYTTGDLLKHLKRELRIEESTLKDLEIVEIYLWRVVFGMGFTIYLLGSVFLLVMARIQKNFSISLDGKIIKYATNIYDTRAWTSITIASPIFMLSLLWEPFFSPSSTKQLIFITTVSFPCIFLVLECFFEYPEEYVKLRNIFLKIIFSVSMLAGTIIVIDNPTSFPLFNYLSETIFPIFSLPFDDQILTFFSILLATMLFFWGGQIWKTYLLESLKTKDPFLKLYNEKMELFIFSIVLRCFFFAASFYPIKDINIHSIIEKALLSFAMAMPIADLRYDLDKLILEIKNFYTKGEIKHSYVTNKIIITKFFNFRFNFDCLWFLFCLPFFYEPKLKYNIYLIVPITVCFFYYVAIILETAIINLNLKSRLNPKYFTKGAANFFTFGKYESEIDKNSE